MSEYLDKLRQFLGGRQYHYRQTFRSPPGEAVLKDLAKFCRANKTTFHEDPRAHAVLEGRREVWLRISQHLNMSPDELWDLYDGRQEQ